MSNSSSRRGSRRRGRARPAVETEIVVESLGAGGDGVSAYQGKPVYAPGLLPGERARVRLTASRGEGRVAETVERLTTSPERVDPPCPHAEECGGCAVQHLSDAGYLAWKTGLYERPLASRGIEAGRLLPMFRAEDGRRRIRLAAMGTAGEAILGFNIKGSRRIVAVQRCVAASPDLADAPATLKPLLDRLLAPGEAADIEVRTSDNGLDVLMIRERPFDLAEREAVAVFAAEAKLARFAWQAADGDIPEAVAALTAPTLQAGSIVAAPPPGAFLQPLASGEAAMADFAARHLAGASRIADLFCGWGPFALRLGGDGVHVEAFEGDAAMIDALNAAARAGGVGEFVEGRARDLARQPLMGEELARFDAVLLDPPRSGAAPQAGALPDAGPTRVVYLSCNPAAFARDARTLLDGGYRLQELQPIDQFRWTPHLELAAYFERDA